jgi:hypothetical protein
MNYKIGDVGWMVSYNMDLKPLMIKEIKITCLYPLMKDILECVNVDNTSSSFMIGKNRFYYNKKACLARFKEDATIYLNRLQDEFIFYQSQMNEVLRDE